ncbi:MAG TPA: response regulator [Chitinivibrionales bacterium]|nr:response regulator [Chitinivibrionales bacterium]
MASEKIPRAHILLVDDEMPICIGVSGLLETMGFTAQYALSGEEGIQYLDSHPETDIVLLDINLGPGKNGIELLPDIRERHKYVQVMMFTSHDSLSTGLECMKKGAADYLTKPFNEKEFLKKVPDVIAKKNIAKLNALYFGILIHDLKSPLQCIMGAWELAKRYLPESLNQNQQRIVTTCDSGVLQMKTMIENILSVAKFEAGSISLSREKFCVNNEVEATLAPLRQQILSSNRAFSIEPRENPPLFLVADRDLYSRILFNIVSNAVFYTPAEGRIAVSYQECADGAVQTSVSNSGSYIEEDQRNMIFDKFSSVQLVKQSAGVRNFGLGLTFCKMAVEAMGGKIRVESDKSVPQTTFIYTIKNIGDN